jgi:hypothetical protein
MLNIYYGDIPEEEKSKYIYNTNIYFDNTYKDKWIISDFAREMIRDVDKSEVLDEKTISSPIFGNMIPKKISGGAKTLLLIAFDRKKIFNASTCGDNCSKWILKLAEDRKVVINLRHLMDFGQGEFKIKVLNTGKIVKNMSELVEEAGEFV